MSLVEVFTIVYSINLESKIPADKKFTAVLLAVAHDEFINLSDKDLKKMIVNNGFFFDLCNRLSRSLKPLRI